MIRHHADIQQIPSQRIQVYTKQQIRNEERLTELSQESFISHNQ